MSEKRFVHYCRKCYATYDTTIDICPICKINTKLHGITQLELPTDVRKEFIAAVKYQLLAHGTGTKAARKYSILLVKWYLSKRVEDIQATYDCLRFDLDMGIDYQANVLVFINRFYGNYAFNFEKNYVNSRAKAS